MRYNNHVNSCSKRGWHLEQVIKKWMPGFKEVDEEENKNGTDLIKNGKTYQVKCDQTIPITGNLYFEIKEKTTGYDAGPWRDSPMNADYYILGYFNEGFDNKDIPISDLITIYMILAKRFRRIKKKYKLKEISSTSKGYLIPINDIKIKKKILPAPKKERRMKPLFEEKDFIL